MKFLSITCKLNTVFASMMGISSPANITLATGSNDTISSPNNFLETLLQIIWHTIAGLVEKVIETLLLLIYSIAKWALTAIDFLFILIRQMVGINGDFSETESLSESDMMFKFVFNERVLRVIKGMIGYALVLLIIFSIFAVIKIEYNYITQGGNNSKKQVLSNALKSLMLMILVPVLFIGGVILSNGVLKSLYIATAGGMDTALGPQIFTTSAYNSNLYRKYANDNFKIPITFNFDEVDNSKDNTGGWGVDGEVADLDAALRDFNESNVWNRGFTTFLMFYVDGFMRMSTVDNLQWKTLGGIKQINKQSSYNISYDNNIFSHRDQYYVMADALDYAVKTETRFYYKTPDQIRWSVNNLPDGPEKNNINNKIYGKIDDAGLEVSVNYNGNPFKLNHIAGAHSESEGAIYLITIEKILEIDDTIYTYYYPLLNGEDNFKSRYTNDGDVVVAKGMFSEEGYPTAIKEEDGAIKFYRDDLNIPTIMDFFPTISYEMPVGATEDAFVSFLKKGVEAITGIDVTQFIPYIYYNIDMFSLFTKKTYNIVTLDDGYLKANYNFSQGGYKISNLYKLLDFNFVIFLCSIFIVLGMMLKVLFGVAHRVMDITLLAITYPAVLATYPLDNGSRFKNWSSTMLQKVLSIYGVVVGTNIVLLLLPVIDGMELFDELGFALAVGNGDLVTSFALDCLNGMVNLLFMLVALTMVQGIPTFIDGLLEDKEDISAFSNPKQKSGLVADGDKTLEVIEAVPKKVGNVISGKVVLDLGRTLGSLVPGGALVAEGLRGIKNHKENSDARNETKKTKKDIQNEIDKAKRGTPPPGGGGTPPPGGGGTPPPGGGGTPPPTP